MIGRTPLTAFSAALLVLVLVPLAGEAATWRTNLGLRGDLLYTDNVFLTPDDETGGTTARITPSITTFGVGRRLRLNFAYAPSYLLRLYDGGDDTFVHNLTASLNSELYKDVFFLDARANAGLTLLNPFGVNPGDGINETDNARQTYSIAVSPYLRQHFGGYADLRIGYTYSYLWGDGFDNSDGHAADFSLVSGRRFQIVDWEVQGNALRTEYQDGRYSVFAKVLGRAGYALSRIWRLNGFLGYEDNNFLSLADQLEEPVSNGAIYGAGLTWTPSPRTTLDIGVADRFFGTNLYFDYRHRQRRNLWTASLTHEPQNARNELLNRQTIQQTDAFGNPIFDAAGQPVFIDPDSPLLTTQDYIRRQFRVGYQRQMRRGSLGANAYYTERNYVDDLLDTTTYGLNASVSRNLAARINARIRAEWYRVTASNEIPDVSNWVLRAGLDRQLGRRTHLSLDLQHRRQDSDIGDNTYTENRAMLSLSAFWD